jgi:hypothetical protein
MEQNSITLREDDIYSAFSILPDEGLTYSKGPNEGKQYYRARFKGLTFTVSPELKALHDAADIQSITFTETKYKVEAADRPGQFDDRTSWTVDGFMTYKQKEGLVRNQGKVARVKHEAMAGIQLSTSEVEQLVNA